MKNCPFSMASWTMNYLELIFLAAIIFPIVGRASGAGECRKYVGARKLYCYDCDSRYDPYCADPFNKTLPPENRPATRVCHGCCVKFVHKFSDEEYIQRSCTESIIINYFMVDHVCMGEGKGHGKMCFCEDNLCNGARPTSLLSTMWTSPFSLLVTTILILHFVTREFYSTHTVRTRVG